MNKIIIGLVGVLVLSGIGYVVFGQKDNEDNATQTSNTSAETQPPENDASTSTSFPAPGNNTNETSSEDGQTFAGVVTYDANGFDPSNLGPIFVGDTVEFRNENSQPLWVASNNHPTHTEYSEFDQKDSIDNGQSWSFTFTQAGTWGYHNHLSPGDMGTIEVLAE